MKEELNLQIIYQESSFRTIDIKAHTVKLLNFKDKEDILLQPKYKKQNR